LASFLVSGFYIGLFWGGFLGSVFAILCFLLIFQKDRILSFAVNPKGEKIFLLQKILKGKGIKTVLDDALFLSTGKLFGINVRPAPSF